MEGLMLLLAGLVLAIPVIAIVALVRSGRVRQLLEESNTEYCREIDVLRAEVANFRRELSQLKERVSQQGASAHPGQSATESLATTTPAINTSVSKPVIAEPPAQVVPQSTLLPIQPLVTPRPVAVESIPQPPAFARAASEPPSKTPIPPSSFAISAIPDTAPPVPSESSTAPPLTTHAHTETRAIHSFQAPAPSLPSGAARKTFAERLRSTLPFEELLGMNLFAKIGIVLLVLGFARERQRRCRCCRRSPARRYARSHAHQPRLRY